METQQPFIVRARVVAASDLMDYVADLLADPKTHPAAPIVLTGAALEERLRALIDEGGFTTAGKPGLGTYGAEPKKQGAITSQEAEQVTAWAGLRNQAAHGEDLDRLTTEHAEIMAAGVNLFLQTHQLPA